MSLCLPRCPDAENFVCCFLALGEHFSLDSPSFIKLCIDLAGNLPVVDLSRLLCI